MGENMNTQINLEHGETNFGGVIDQDFVRKFASFINSLNISQNNKEVVPDIQSHIQNEMEKISSMNGYSSVFQNYSQTSDLIFGTQEKTNSSFLEKIDNVNEYNQNNTGNTIDEQSNQNFISLSALKGRMSQDALLDTEARIKPKNATSELNWQEGKVSIKKGKVKVECNYAFTPTKSSLRGFINHRGKCIYFKNFQNISLESTPQQFNPASNNKYTVYLKEKLHKNTSGQKASSLGNFQVDYNIFNNKSHLKIHDNTNEDVNLQVNSGTFNGKYSKENINDRNKLNFKNTGIINSQNDNIHFKEGNGLNRNGTNFEIPTFNSIDECERNANKSKNNFENFKLHLYSAISCLPKNMLVKILRKRNPQLTSIADDKNEELQRDELIKMILSPPQKKQIFDNSEKLESGALQNSGCPSDTQDNKTLNKKSFGKEFDLEIIKSENQLINSNEDFQMNIPVFFRHSLPKGTDWKCNICKSLKNGDEVMIMCDNCGYVYHLACQSQSNKKKNDWFCDFCKTHNGKLKPESKFQIGELVWVSYKGTVWPGQIIDFMKELFEIIIFHIEKRVEKSSNEIFSWSKGIVAIDGLASKGVFLRESVSSIMYWQSVYKGIKYYVNSLRSNQRRLPSSKKTKKSISTESKNVNKKKKIETNNIVSELPIAHPLPSEIEDILKEDNFETGVFTVNSQMQI
ncbi:PHD finger containing protein [Cryptosporidium felis]|nr:PHD finger containing protein [Cryptosporidium felis]